MWKQVLAVALCAGCAVPVEARVKRRVKAPARAKRAVKAAKITPAMLRGKIVYEQNGDLWAVAADGTGKIRVSATLSSGSSGWLPTNEMAFSPDRSRIAFVYDRPNDDPYQSDELFVARLGNTSRKQITNRDYADGIAGPQWSPDGKRILYTRWTGKHWGGPMQADADIWVINADGSGHRRVIGDYREPDASHSGARWSRDGRRIFFLRTEGDIPESPDYPRPEFAPWSCALDGSDAKPLTNNWGEFLLPEVSPDGRFRLVLSEADEARREYTPLTLHDIQKGESRALTNDASTQFLHARWGPSSEDMAVGWSHSLSINGIPHTLRGIDIISRDGTRRWRLAGGAKLVAWLS